MTKGSLIIISGPSGVGKSTVVKWLLEKSKRTVLSVSATTRLPREGEIDGREYFFLSFNEFMQRVKNEEMLEYAEYVGNYYGTPANTVDKLLNEGYDVILEIEVLGAMQVIARRPDTISIFILPPDADELENRLRGRGTENETLIQRRIQKAREELKYASKYRFNVINENVGRTASEILRIIKNCKKSL